MSFHMWRSLWMHLNSSDGVASTMTRVRPALFRWGCFYDDESATSTVPVGLLLRWRECDQHCSGGVASTMTTVRPVLVKSNFRFCSYMDTFCSFLFNHWTNSDSRLFSPPSWLFHPEIEEHGLSKHREQCNGLYGSVSLNSDRIVISPKIQIP